MTANILGEQGIIVLVVALVLLFGGSRLPDLAKSLGRSKREFEEGLSGKSEAAPQVESKTAE